MSKALVLACCAVFCLAACGSAAKPKTAAKQCVSPKAMAKLNTDIAALRRARSNSAAINRATDRFLLDVATAPITNLKRNRMIDPRPIPTIRTGARC